MRRIFIGFLSVLLVCAGVGGWLYLPQKPFLAGLRLQRSFGAQDHRIVVFVHGTFGAVLSLLDAPGVLRDNVKGSFYEKAVSKARADQFFFRSQPMHQCGLVPFEPSLDRHESIGFFAAYPIAKTFDAMCEQTKNAAEQRHYYLFGWSGLLSQASRRQEAVRLLNQLSEEVKKFKERGIDPKISLICHSHGGNIALNVGLIVSFLRGEELSGVPGVVHAKSYKRLRLLLGFLPDRNAVEGKMGQQRWDYAPHAPTWNIDQAVLLATPIQPETDAGALSSVFNQVYNCYSYGDKIQVSDWISTSRYFSERRFTRVKRLLRCGNQSLPARVKQVRIMVGRQKNHRDELPPTTSFADPTHKDFWFLLFRRQGKPHLFKPLPILVLFPLISDVLQKNNRLVDVDVNIATRCGALSFEVLNHNERAIVATNQISQELFEAIRVRVSAWSGDVGFFAKILQALHLL